jgi:hypothetical protein
MARYSILINALVVAIIATSVTAFAPGAQVRRFAVAPGQVTSRSTPLNMGFMGDEPPKLTRDSEPDEFFTRCVYDFVQSKNDWLHIQAPIGKRSQVAIFIFWHLNHSLCSPSRTLCFSSRLNTVTLTR